MSIRLLVCSIALATCLASVESGDAKFPQPGSKIPGTFTPINVNGMFEGKPHCLVSHFGLNPVVMVFVREAGAGKDQAVVEELLKKLDDDAERLQERSFGAFVVFLSPDANISSPKEENANKLVEETLARQALHARLKARTEKLKNVPAAYYASEGPKGYDISPKNEVTAYFCRQHEVIAGFTFAPGAMKSADVDAIIKKVNDTLTKKK